MSRGKYLSFEEARKTDQMSRFYKEHPSTGDMELWDRLFLAMAHGGPPSRKKAKAAKASSQDDDAC